MIFTPTSGMKDQVVDLNPLDMKRIGATSRLIPPPARSHSTSA
jgi:hypothetical protein